MKKEFNTEGDCIPEKHFMVDIAPKIEEIFQLVEKGKYFTMNRPRQFGKTTVFSLLAEFLKEQEGYFPIDLSFEEMDSSRYQSGKNFIQGFLFQLQHILQVNQNEDLAKFIQEQPELEFFDQLGHVLTQLVIKTQKKVILLIDEVDKSMNNQLFLDFLGMLRAKYLRQNKRKDVSFHSVILAGVHDIKTLKLKIHSGEKEKPVSPYNSPWNIAAEFNIDLSFQPHEIETMLSDYVNEKKISMNIPEIAECLYYYTSGYPFLVSKLCKVMDEKLPENYQWNEEGVNWAVQEILPEKNTNFETLIKNIENHEGLALLIHNLLFEGVKMSYNVHNPQIELGEINGIFRNENGVLKIHNRIYSLLIYDYLSSKIETTVKTSHFNLEEDLTQKDGTLNLEKVLFRFQDFMKQEYSQGNETFLEKNGRLIFLAFLKPILNGKGFAFKEAEVSEEKRLDLVITYLNQKFVVELKIWRGEKAHQKGIKQLSDYLDRQNMDRGYLTIFDFRKEKKSWKQENIQTEQKEIFAIWV